MNNVKKILADCFKLIKAPKYFYTGIGILVTIFLFLPILKLLAIILAILLIFISFFPDHMISQHFNGLIERFKNW
ncbi:MAG: hypothetical protein KZQ83_05645 [gamma proteobacterium symbiont of Taylorina sp.]|nr:hypothetical protein [gamma proteobacterium symbiont of Taylorina sp.]